MLPLPFVLLGLLAAAPAAPRPSMDGRLRAHCLAGAADPKNPWALAHGLVLEGRRFSARDGRPAADVIVSDFLQPSGFPPATADGTPVEPHPALQVKTLLRAGHPLSHRFRARWGPVTLGALVESLKRDFRPDSASSPEGAWTLDALSQVLSPGATFTTGAGEVVRFDAVMDEALATLEHAQAELLAGMRAGQRQVPKRQQGIYAHPCGGLHFFQAVAGWARHPSVRERWGSRLSAQVDVLFYRLDSEARQYEAAFSAEPRHRLPVLVQQVKFYGHLLETLGRYREETGWRPTPAQAHAVERARGMLDGAVRRLAASGALGERASPRVLPPSLTLELLGDACHAAKGVHYWRDDRGG
jgi:hypothetical protein